MLIASGYVCISLLHLRSYASVLCAEFWIKTNQDTLLAQRVATMKDSLQMTPLYLFLMQEELLLTGFSSAFGTLALDMADNLCRYWSSKFICLHMLKIYRCISISQLTHLKDFRLELSLLSVFYPLWPALFKHAFLLLTVCNPYWMKSR